MRLSQVLVVVAASFLFTSEALSAKTDSHQAQIADPTLIGDLGARLLRSHHTVVEADNDSEETGFDNVEDDSEERALLPKDYTRLTNYAEKLGIDVQRAATNTAYLSTVKKEYDLYQALLNRLIQKRKSKKAPRITTE
ncbi:Secreted RxLR effector peptide protein [Phytophthora palmivora]|uniref:RxLR effector protein n=1 Tax=Phytophthora palmivora TaxID=4796 RepID=A0A2P4YTK3_9STRA|nr:Secreted RxLR effector peptide protein [Phytophthora palmivora]